MSYSEVDKVMIRGGQTAPANTAPTLRSLLCATSPLRALLILEGLFERGVVSTLAPSLGLQEVAVRMVKAVNARRIEFLAAIRLLVKPSRAEGRAAK